MLHAKAKYSADPHIAEVYDGVETERDDVELLRRLIGERRGLKVFEPFCGTGRLAIPLAEDGHSVIGLDAADGMLARFEKRLAELPEAVRRRVLLVSGSALESQWPQGMDVVLLGGNCFYDLSSAEEHHACIEKAAAALVTGGHVFIDNDDHPSATLDPSWQKPPGTKWRAFPSGACADGTRIDATTQVVRTDVPRRVTHYLRRAVVTHPDGRVDEHEWEETCCPAFAPEIEEWLAEAGFVIEERFGEKNGSAYCKGSPRFLAWARRALT